MSLSPVQQLPESPRWFARHPYLILALIAAATLFYRLGALPFVGADEPRYARIAEEMWGAGEWVTPLLQGYPWLEKPPLYYWATIPFYVVFGVSEATARLAPALSALLASWVIGWSGARMWGQPAGLLGGAITLTCIGFSVFGRGASTDMPFTACFSAAMALLCAAAAGERTRRACLAAAYALLGLAVLAKGPVALILAAGILVLFWTFDDRGGSLRRLWLAPGLALAVLVAAPWFWLAFRENGFSFLAVFFINHNLARYVSDVHHHFQPFYYYLPVVLGLMFPWTGWLLGLAGRLPRALKAWRRWDRGLLFAACWFLFPLVFFSLSSSKLPSYILVSLPPLALMLASALAGRMEGRSRAGDGPLLGWAQLAVSLALAAAFPVVMATAYGEDWIRALPLSFVVLVPSVACAWALRRGKWRGATAATVLQGLLLVLALTHFAFPVIAARHSTREIAFQALQLRQEAETIVTYRFFHHSLYYYTGYTIDAEPKDIQGLMRYAYGHPHFLIVTEDRYVAEIGGISGFSAHLLGSLGKLRLLRLSHF